MIDIAEGMALVRQECCNLISNVCVGMTLRGTRFREMGKCWIAEKKKCQYYNKCIYPLIAIQQRVKDKKKKARKRVWN